MRLLHVGWAFQPLRWGGLMVYAEDLMRHQVRAGHEVAYFCAGRHYPFLPKGRLHRWTREGVRMHEVINPPIPFGGLQGVRDPELSLSEPRLEALFRRVLERERPDVVHVHELQALPSSLLDVARAARVPTVLTLHDHYLLCPTAFLFDADERTCERTEPGAMCQVCCRDAPADTREERGLTLRYDRGRLSRRLPVLRRLARGARAVRRGLRAPEGPAAAAPGDPAAPADAPEAPVAAQAPLETPEPTAAPTPALTALRAARPPASGHPASKAAYDRRRAVNVARLNRVDALVAVSRRTAALNRRLGVDPARMRTVHPTVDHFRTLLPRRFDAPPAPVRFASLDGGSGRHKGAGVLADAVERLEAQGLDGTYELSVFGRVVPAAAEAFERYPSVRLRGTYAPEDLDGLLVDVDVGIVASQMEEPYGFVGIEMLAKGIPVIGSARGGIPDYVVPGRTGWLNDSASGGELAAIMADVIARPEQVLDLHRSVVADRDVIITPTDRHLAELEALYEEVKRLA